MVYKVYKSNNYIIIIDENDNYFEEHCANVLVTKLLTPSTTYDITFFRTESVPQAFYGLTFANIKQQSGAPYASVAAWETWYTTNTGLCSNAAVLNSILATLQAQTDVEGVFVKDLGNSDKIVLQVKVWDQDSQVYIATYYYNPDGTLYTPVGPLEWVGTAGSVNATIISPLGDTTTCGDAVAVTYCASQATEFFNQGDTLDSILTELQSTLDVNITNLTLAVTQSGVWNINAIQSGTWTVALDAATLSALETITVEQGTSPWVVSGTVDSVQSGTWNVNVANFPATQNVAVTSIVEVEVKNDSGNPLPISGTVTITDGSGPLTVDATDLDIRNLTFATDKVDISGSNVLVTGAVTATIDCADSSIKVCDADGDILNVNPDGSINSQSSTLDGLGTPITSTTAGPDTGLDVNVIGGIVGVTQNTTPWLVNSTSTVRIPTILRVTGGATIAPGARSFSILNAGSGAASILGGTNNLLPGEEVDFVAGGNDSFGLITFNGNGVTTLVVTYVS